MVEVELGFQQSTPLSSTALELTQQRETKSL